MSEEISTVESLGTGRAGWARVTGMIAAARRIRSSSGPGNGYFEAGLIARESYRL